MNKYFKIMMVLILFGTSSTAYSQTFIAEPDTRLQLKISKSGLNRISNPPYKIVQVTGDDATFRLKYDEDGENIYLMPMKGIGEKIEIALKNNAGNSYDLELEIANTCGQTIEIVRAKTGNTNTEEKKKDLQSMLKAMQLGREGKFYVQNVRKQFEDIDGLHGLKIVQTKIYKWQDLVGSVFLVRNNSRIAQKFDSLSFIKHFDNVLTSFITQDGLAPKTTTQLFVIQEIKNEI